MSKADKKLEELYFIKQEQDEIYGKFWDTYTNVIDGRTINFNFDYKKIYFDDVEERGFTIEELQAINEKVKELCWG